jgi:hypothetical protein
MSDMSGMNGMHGSKDAGRMSIHAAATGESAL